MNAKGYLENVRRDEEVFTSLALMIDRDLKQQGAQRMMIEEVGRIIGTAKYIGTHINLYIARLDNVIASADSLNKKQPTIGATMVARVRAGVESLPILQNQRLSSELSSIADSIAEDIKWLKKALRIEIMLEKQTPKGA